MVERWKKFLVECKPTETVLIVSHGDPIRLLLGHVKGLDIAPAIMEQSQAHSSINEFRYDHETGVTEVVRENDTNHYEPVSDAPE